MKLAWKNGQTDEFDMRKEKRVIAINEFPIKCGGLSAIGNMKPDDIFVDGHR